MNSVEVLYSTAESPKNYSKTKIPIFPYAGFPVGTAHYTMFFSVVQFLHSVNIGSIRVYSLDSFAIFVHITYRLFLSIPLAIIMLLRTLFYDYASFHFK